MYITKEKGVFYETEAVLQNRCASPARFSSFDRNDLLRRERHLFQSTNLLKHPDLGHTQSAKSMAVLGKRFA